MIDLLSPVGNFDCLKAAIQNGADSVYFGSSFSARAYANNFNTEELKEAINYAKIRGVKTNLTLNTLIRDDELSDAFEVAKNAYEFGIDAIIVQDLGLARLLIKSFPDLSIHASTQMSIHNLLGVLKLQELGFKRVVLARELSMSEIEYICNNSNIEIECFIHGALCISYSGQCLFSSMLGGRSGNRGQCAQPCRLPYDLLENDTVIDKGHLLSTRDICGLDFIPSLIKAGVSCLKIEGRMKSPEYVATVTRIYRKYIDLAQSTDKYIVDEVDRKILLQAFNRGMSSPGHLSNNPNHDLVYKEKPNNMGLFLGIVQKYNSSKGYITLKLNEEIEIGDTISLEQETGSYTVSEVMANNKNISSTKIGQIVTIGRMKGNINLGDKIYKISSKKLNIIARDSMKNEYRKIGLNCTVSIKKNLPIHISITSANNIEWYKNLEVQSTVDILPVDAKSTPLTKERINNQINKTSDSPFEFKNIKINLDDNLFLPKISALNELRRNALEKVHNYVSNKITRKTSNFDPICTLDKIENSDTIQGKSHINISVLLNILDENFDYSILENIDNIYIPLKYFSNQKYEKCLKVLSSRFNMYIYFPTIIKANYRNLLTSNIENSIKSFNIKGFIISNISNLLLLKNIFNELTQYELKNFKIISNYTLNVYNSNTIKELKKLGVSTYTISPELGQKYSQNLLSQNILNSEMIIYGKIPVLNMNYCLLGKSNKCYPKCIAKCNKMPIEGNKYYIKDRYNFKFTVLPDNIQTVTTIYNNRTTNLPIIEYPNLKSARIDILYENIDEINKIIKNIRECPFRDSP